MKKYALALSCALAALFFVSCGSTPEPEPTPTPEPEQPVVENPVQVEQPVTQDDFSAANAQLLAGTEAARAKALAADAKTFYPEAFDSLDAEYETLKNDVASNPSEDYSVRIKDLTAKYESLAVASEAQALKKRVDSMDFASLDQSAYDNAGKALSEYDAMGIASSGADLLAKANEAKDGYKELMNKGLVAIAGRERQTALEAKKKADSVKAGVAQKEVYTKASDTFKKADSSYVTANIEGAYQGYKSAKETFNQLYESIFEKRAAAQAAIDRAKQKVSDSANYAEEADSIAPLASEVAGIEKEDAVLLEQDELANPDDAIINVEDSVTAKTAEKAATAAIAVENTITDIANDVVTDINAEAK